MLLRPEQFLLAASLSTCLAQPSPTPQHPTDTCPSLPFWPPTPQGTPYTSQPPSPLLLTILSSISPARIQATVEKLASFGTRHTLSTQTDPLRGIGAARDWIREQYEAYAAESEGFMSVEVQSYVQGVASRVDVPTRISNVVATMRGSEGGDGGRERIVVVSGHYDSRNTDIMNRVDDAPGADDDASGVAISMELARIMAKFRPKATIIFAAVAGEEQGLYGSTYLAQTLANRSAYVEGMWTNDIVGSPIGDDGKNQSNIIRLFAQGTPTNESARTASQRLSVGGENDSPTRQLARFTRDVASNDATGMSVEVQYRADRYLRGGDHLPFLAAGYAAARFTEPREDFAHQHQDVRVEDGKSYGDLPEFCDWYYIARVARVTGAAVWSLADAPDRPGNVTIETTRLTNDSTFFWAKVPGAVGYEVVWRPTAQPFWTHVFAVGDVDTATVEVSKDNVEFGIRSVGANGYRSPAVFPFPV